MILNYKTLNFPKCDFRLRKNSKDVYEIFDVIRKKFVVLTPEEWVRQHVIHFLTKHKKFPAALIAIEKQLILNNTKRRADIVVYKNNLNPLLIVECKAPEIEISQMVVEQAQRYNLTLKVPVIFITNGCKHHLFRAYEDQLHVIQEFPEFEQLINL